MTLPDRLNAETQLIADHWQAAGDALRHILNQLPPIPPDFDQLPASEQEAFRAEMETAMARIERAQAIRHEEDLVANANSHWLRGFALRGRVKPWFNRRWPYWARCLKPWCWRGIRYQHRCHVHVTEVLAEPSTKEQP